MKQTTAIVVGVVGVVLAAAIGIAVYLFTRPQKVLERATVGKAPIAAPKQGCSPEAVQQGVQSAISAGQGGAAGGPAGAAAGAGISGLVDLMSGPCAPEIQKKLNELLQSADQAIRKQAEKANHYLHGLDFRRRRAQDVITGGPLRRAAVKKAKAAIKNLTSSPGKATKKLRKKLHF